MNVFIGIAILLSLIFSDSLDLPVRSATDAMIAMCWVLALGLVPPLFATLQVLYTRTKFNPDNSESRTPDLHRQTTIHAVLWLTASLAFVTILPWPEIVRNYWQLNHYLLLDELIILAPMLTSLLVSWAIQFDYQSERIAWEDRFKEQLRFVGLRCRVYLAIILLPLGLMIFIKDLWPYLGHVSPTFAMLSAIGLLSLMFCMMPLLISLLWPNRSISEVEGRRELLQLCERHQMSVKDIRIWDTGNQIINALVAGMLPRFRLLMMSDLLLASFPKNELKAVISHEAGHVRLNHLTTRIGFLLLPAVAMVCIESDHNRTLQSLLDQLLLQINLNLDPGIVFGLTFIGYVCIITGWLSRNMEFEADLYAVGAFGNDREDSLTEMPNAPQALSDALLRFAEQAPEQMAKRSLTHPSLMERIDVLKKFVDTPDTALRFRKRFLLQQTAIAFIIFATTVVLIAV